MNKIAQIRNELGITQSQLAERIGWKQPRIANYEAGIRMPSLIAAQEIVKALNSFGAKKSINDVFPVQN